MFMFKLLNNVLYFIVNVDIEVKKFNFVKNQEMHLNKNSFPKLSKYFLYFRSFKIPP